MIRSFHYAAFTALRRHARTHPGDAALLAPWLETWFTYVSGAFLRAYRQRLGDAPLLPPDPAETELMLQAFLLEKAIYELGYELNNRPDWVGIPLAGIEMILNTPVPGG
jgi:maltose alpha-D-glucosyltransferase/alpha-amylase